MITVLIADDEFHIRRLIKDFLMHENINVIEAQDGNEALLKFYENEKEIDLILLDIMMPYIDGLEVLKKIRENSNIPIIMLTAKSEDETQITGFSYGANDYVTKPFSPMVLISRIKNQLKLFYNNEIIISNFKINTSQRKIFINEKEEYLTLKEYELLMLLIKNMNIAISREEILNNVWEDKEGDSRTVDTHIKQLRTKLVNAKINIETIRGFGYMLIEKS